MTQYDFICLTINPAITKIYNNIENETNNKQQNENYP